MSAAFYVDVVLRARNAQSQIGAVDRALQGIDKTAMRVARNMDRMFRLGAAAILVAQFVNIVDSYTTLQNKVAAVTSTFAEQKAVMDEVFAVANRARVPVEAVGSAYQRLRNATETLGLSQSQVLRMTETLSKGMLIYGATQSEATSTMTQFTQALQKGKLDGDEFRSMMENSPPIVKLLAKELNVTKGELFALSKSGKISTRVLVDALVKGAKDIDAQFGKLTPTINQSLTVLRNQFIKFVGEMVTSSGVVQAISAAILYLADNFDTFMKVVTAAGNALAVIFVGKGIKSAIAGIKLLGAAVAANPFTALIMAIIFIGSLLYKFDVQISSVGAGTIRFQKLVEVAWAKIKSAMGGALTALGDTLRTVFSAFYAEFKDLEVGFGDILVFVAIFIDKFIMLVEFLAQTVIAIFVGIPVGILAILVQGFGYILKALEYAVNKIIDAYNYIARKIPGIGSKLTIGRADLGADAILDFGDDLDDVVKAAVLAAKDSWDKLSSSTLIGPVEKMMRSLLEESIEGGKKATTAVADLGKTGADTFKSVNGGAKKTKDTFEQLVEKLYPTTKALDDLRDAKIAVDKELGKNPKETTMTLEQARQSIADLNNLFQAGALSAAQLSDELQRTADLMKRTADSRITGEEGLRILDRQRYLLLENADALQHYNYQAGEAGALADILYASKSQLPAQFAAEIAAREKLNELVEKGIVLSEYELMARKARGQDVTGDEAYREEQLAQLRTSALIAAQAAEVSDRAADANKRLAKRIEESYPPAQRYKDMLSEINEQLAFNSLTVAQAEVAIANLNKEFGFKDENFEKVRKMREEIAEMVSGLTLLSVTFDALNTEIKDLVMNGEASFERLVESMLSALTDLILKIIETWITMKLLESMGPQYSNSTGGMAGLISGGLSAIGQGFADGGQFKVGGQPGRDQNVVAFRASRGEDVTIRTPAQRRAEEADGQSSSPPPIKVTVINHLDPGQVVPVMDSRAGRRTVLNGMRFAPRAVGRLR